MTEETNEKASSSEKSSSKNREKSNKFDKVKVLKKVVIRRLPPSMNEETFLKQIEPLPDHDNYYFVPADWSLGQDATARAYINFLNQDDIFLFKDRFDGYVFVDNKGAEYPAVVEFAPFQGLPRNKSRKKDSKVNSIETDPHYISFLETLNKEDADIGKGEFKLEYSFQLKDDKKVTSTPLLQYLANKKQERRDERKRKLEEKRRQRDEERQRKKTQIAKSIPQAITEEDAKDDRKLSQERSTEKKIDREKAIDERKESRNRRRDQRRKEERERKAQETQINNSTTKSDAKNAEEEDKKKKESKKNNLSRREKQRSRDENRRAEAISNVDSKGKESSTSQPGTPSIQNVTPSQEQIKPKEEISESVKEFIKSCKEFAPRTRILGEVSTLEGNKSIDTESGYAEVLNKLQQISVLEKPDKKSSKITSESREKKAERDKDGANNNIDKGREDRNARRIRNKDRPSIEIYQPRKMRLSSSAHKDESGRSSCEPKDYKSNPTSDCESIKLKDEKSGVKKKVSRYSERRSGRIREQQSKDSDDKKEIISEVVSTPAEEDKNDENVKSDL